MLAAIRPSTISAVDTQSTLYVRATFTGATSGTNANTRIDNAQFNATSIIPPFLALIHPVTGEIVLRNGSASSLEFDNYWITSPANALLSANGSWNSLDDQNYDADGNGTGQSWDESGGSNASQISESYLLGSTTLDPGELVSIGKAYNTSIVDANMTLRYHDVNSSPTSLLDGGVVFVMLGDMDGDGDVTDLDVPLFVQALTDRAAYDTAQPNIDADFVGDFDGNGLLDVGDLGAFSLAVNAATASGNSTAVPEPSTWALIGTAIVGFIARFVSQRKITTDVEISGACFSPPHDSI